MANITNAVNDVYPRNSTQFRVFPNIYPLPYELTKLVQPVLTYADSLAHPSLLENADTIDLIKVFHYKLWADNMINTNSFSSMSDLIKSEVKIFEHHGFAKRPHFQVTWCAICILCIMLVQNDPSARGKCYVNISSAS